jgi:hypothetical protein
MQTLPCARQVIRSCEKMSPLAFSFVSDARCVGPIHKHYKRPMTVCDGTSTMMFSLQSSKWALPTAMHCEQYNNSTIQIAIDRRSNAMPPTLDEFFNFFLNIPKFNFTGDICMLTSLQSLPPRGMVFTSNCQLLVRQPLTGFPP